MHSEPIVQALLDYLNDSDEPDIFQSDKDFKHLCFSRWAAEEMIEAIMSSPTANPEDTIEAFAIKMLACSTMWTKNSEQGLIFKTASDFAFDCLEIFREENSNDKANHC